ncbi:MAG: glycosyltransferase [Desulfobacula sp.]|jgi:hypothetical protein|nr:glycosyltransferase [Desulfobacula sp.]
MIEKFGVEKSLNIKSNNLDALKLNEKIIEKTGFWSPPVPAWEPLKHKTNSNLCMACVVEERVYQGFRFEGKVMLLTPGTWEQVLTYGKPDFLLMDSFLISACGNWHMGQGEGSPEQENLLQILDYAGKKSIPTVYWMTKGHEYHDLYKGFSQLFDYVFCADPRELEKMKADGIQADILLPCIQPAIHNPFRHYDHYDTFGLNVLYDGWADLDRLQGQLSVLNEIQTYGLSIIESRYRIFQNRKKIFPEYRDSILGCTTRQGRISALKYAKTYITFQQTLSTQTEQQWMTLEAAGCRLAVIHNGALKDEDVRKNIVIECADTFESLLALTRFKEDDLYRERVAHKGWRAVHQSHSFFNRLKRICEKSGIERHWNEFPKASVITPTYRREKLKRCLETFEGQSYPNRELIIVFNGNHLPSLKDLGIDQPMENVKIINVPGDLFAGACINCGHLQATGQYCFRMDDDDHYGVNYISDMILSSISIDAELFGKPPSPLSFEDDHTVYLRENRLAFCIVPYNLLAQKDIRIGGNSISGQRQFFKNVQYDDLSFEAADSSLLYQLPTVGDGFFALVDGLNLVAERRVDQTTHTWKIETSKFKNSDKVNSIMDMMI